MPTYNFRNKDTGEVIERIMSITAREEFLQANPNMETYHAEPPAMGDSVRLGVRRPDQGFKEVLQKIHEKTAGSQLNRTTRDI